MNGHEVYERWTILVVEDDEGLNALVRKTLERGGFKTLGAFTAEEALKNLDNNPKMLVILDYKLPDIDGVGFIKEISEQNGKAHYIVLTGQGDEHTAVEFMKLGARDYLIKEANILDYLPETIKRVIREIETEESLRIAELQLKHSEAKYRALVDNLGEGIVVFDDDGNMTFANMAAKALLDLGDSGLLGRNIREFIDEGVFLNVQNIIKRGEFDKLTNMDLTVEASSGDQHEVIFSIVVPMMDESTFNGFIGTFRDITERVRAQREVKYMAQLVDGVSDAIISTNDEFKIASWNNAAEKLYGWKAQEVVGRPISEVLKTEYPDGENSEQTDGEVVQKRKDGSEIIALPAVSFLKEEGKESSGMVVVYHDITDRKHAESELKKSFERLKKVFDSVVDVIGKIVEVRDPYTAGHERQVAKLAVAIAKKMELPQEQIDAIGIASALHDIGKVYVPSEILSKPGILSRQEFELIKVHPALGFEILETIDFPWKISDIVLQHHERLDGSGYPNGIKGKDILLEAKIIAVADVVEAMSSHRPYRPAPGIEAALDEIAKNRGKLYEPKVVDICIRLFREDCFTL